ncbi:MAG: PEP-CTERM sorting domain-containing protein [Planctomycetia bacterium]|nr:PEP-CTERM sorting domain-containing protein [Planctomycetia bacterium]
MKRAPYSSISYYFPVSRIVKSGVALFLAVVLSPVSPVTAEVTLQQDANFNNDWILSGSGTYSEAINLPESTLVLDSTKRVTGSSANMMIKGDITVGGYLQRDSYFEGFGGGQGGWITFSGNSTQTVNGSMEIGGHTTINIGNDANSTANFTVTGDTLIGSTMTSNMYVRPGSTFSANGGFKLNENGAQGHLELYGTMNLNSAVADSIRLGTADNKQYTSSVKVQNGGVLNAKNTVVHCGYNGQLQFFLNSGGTANIYGITYGRNGDQDSAYANANKTLNLLGGTLNLGAGGVSVREGKDSYPFQFRSGTVSTMEGTTDTTIQNVEIAVGDGATHFKPAEGASITVSSNFIDSTYTEYGTGGVIHSSGTGTLDIAGNFTTTGGLSADSGKTVISGTFADGKLVVNGGTTEITGNLTTADGVEVNNGATLRLNYNDSEKNASKAPITVNAGGKLEFATTGTTNQNGFYHPITLNGGTIVEGTGDWKHIREGILTLTADSYIETRARIALSSPVYGENYTLTKSGGGQLCLGNDETYLKKVVITNGILYLDANNSGRNITEGILVEGGYYGFWGTAERYAKVTFSKNGYLQSNASNSGSTTDSIYTLQDATNFNISNDEGAKFTMRGKLVAADGIILQKTGEREFVLTGDTREFQGIFQIDSGSIILKNGGNESGNTYNFGVTLNGGTLEIGDNGTYQIGKAITSKKADAKIINSTGATGSLSLGKAGNTVTFAVEDGKSLTVETPVTTQGGAFTKTGNGTLDIHTLNVTSGTFNLGTSAVDSVTETINVSEGVKLTGSADLNANLVLAGNNTIEVALTGTKDNWNADAIQILEGSTLTIAPTTVFELTSDITDTLSLDMLFTENGVTLLESAGADFSGLSFDVIGDTELFGTSLIAMGNALGNIYLSQSTQVPEPATWVLLLAGVFGMLVWKRYSK